MSQIRSRMRAVYVDEATFTEQVAKLDSTYRLLAAIALGLIVDLAISVVTIISYMTDKLAEPFFLRDRPAFDPFPCIFLFCAAVIIYWVWKPWPTPLTTAHDAPLLAGESSVQCSAYSKYVDSSDEARA